MKVKFTQLAIDDLAEIGRHTRQNWGDEQVKRYHTALTEKLKWISRNKPLWHNRPELGEGVYTVTEQAHIIVFW